MKKEFNIGDIVTCAVSPWGELKARIISRNGNEIKYLEYHQPRPILKSATVETRHVWDYSKNECVGEREAFLSWMSHDAETEEECYGYYFAS